jgi:hypothetical protein
MTEPQNALSITVPGAPFLPKEVLMALYRITGRSTVELRHAVADGEPVFRAALFGNDHLDVVPRLEKAVAYLDSLGVPLVVHEWIDGEREEISREVMRGIIEGSDGAYA